MISKGSCDTEDDNDAENQSLPSQKILHLKIY